MEIKFTIKFDEITKTYGEKYNTREKILEALEIRSSNDFPIFIELIYPIVEDFIGTNRKYDFDEVLPSGNDCLDITILPH